MAWVCFRTIGVIFVGYGFAIVCYADERKIMAWVCLRAIGVTCMKNVFAIVCYADERKIMALVCLRTIGVNMYGKWFCKCLLCRRKKNNGFGLLEDNRC